MAINPHIEKLKREAAEYEPEYRYCVDCRFYSKFGGYRARCLETDNYISTERSTFYEGIHRCGPEGKLWQKRPPKVSFWKRLWHKLTGKSV